MKVSVGLKLISVFKFREPHFGTLYLSNQAKLDFGTLAKLEITRSSTTFVTTACAKTKRIRSYEGRKIEVSMYFEEVLLSS